MELQSKKKTNMSKGNKHLMTRFTEVIVSVAAFCIAIGEIDATAQAVNHYYEKFVSEFTDTYDYQKLNKIHVGNTQNYLETLFGKPMVAKDFETIDNKTYNVYYYFTDKYLLTVFFLKQRITAYTVLNFKSDFHPRVNAIEKKNLGQFAFKDLKGLIDYTLDASAAITSFIQIHEYGRQGFFRKYYYAYVGYAAHTLANTDQLTLIGEAANLEMMGDEAFEGKFIQLQQNFRPNMYGEGEVDLNLMRKSLLTEFEFKSYFSREKI